MQLRFLSAHCELSIVLIFFICTIAKHCDVGASDTVVWERTLRPREFKEPVHGDEWKGQ